MAWYDTTNTGGMREVKYDPSTTRKTIAESTTYETANKKAQYEQAQTQNMDAAFTDAVEKEKKVNPDGSTTFSFFLDPDKYSQALFKRSKESGVPFKMDDAEKYGQYQLARMQRTNQMAGQAKAMEQQKVMVEGKPASTQEVQKPLVTTPESAGMTKKGKDGRTYTFDGRGWYTDEAEGSF